ncbi:type II toxin-antitoxin system mRNA interferase toxin, RelE/StbE family [Nanoarchaeota archaeon NZ13-N]|nr:MAG: type II toxin-antitoxin system mRNA interferase toxin, RelE/StbE family [Nanoarchaeota archaeon NZ13-N]
MFTIEYTDKVNKFLDKVKNRDHILYKSIVRKIEQIEESPYRFKPLRYDLKHYRRVHVKEPFVLVYKIDEKNRKIIIIDIDHHDKIYKKRFE